MNVNIIPSYLLILCILIGVLSLLLAVVPYLKKKNIPVAQALDTAEVVLNKTDTILNVVKQIIPANPVINILTVVEKWAKIAVGNAEQLYHAGDIEKDERAAVAEEVMFSVLQELKIQINDNTKVLIDAAIKEAVMALGHKDTPAPSPAPDTVTNQVPETVKETADSENTNPVDVNNQETIRNMHEYTSEEVSETIVQ